MPVQFQGFRVLGIAPYNRSLNDVNQDEVKEILSENSLTEDEFHFAFLNVQGNIDVLAVDGEHGRFVDNLLHEINVFKERFLAAAGLKSGEDNRYFNKAMDKTFGEFGTLRTAIGEAVIQDKIVEQKDLHDAELLAAADVDYVI